MEFFLMILTFIIFFIILNSISKKRKSRLNQELIALTQEKKKESNIKLNQKLPTKNIDLIKSENHKFNTYEIKGAAFNICKKLNIWEDEFNGYIKITYNEKDKHAIGVYRLDNILVGWLPKNNKELYEYLKLNQINNLPCWGYFTYQQERENWVSFFTNITNSEIKELHNLLNTRIYISSVLDNTTNYNEIFKALDKLNELETSYSKLEHLEELEKQFLPHNYIASFSKKLENEQNWNNLIKLENYRNYFTEKTVLKRIEKAKLFLEEIKK